MMEYRQLGKSSLKVSVIGFGNWLTGNNPAELLKNKEIMKHAWDLGINFFNTAEDTTEDTAEVYGLGQAEIQMGEALNELMRERNIPREDLVITTKLFLGSVGSDKRKPNEAYLSRKSIIEGLQASLKRLNLSYVDILYAHRYDNITPLEEQCRAFDWCIRKGYCTYWGTSEWSTQQIIEAMGVCERLNLHKPIVVQSQQTMFNSSHFEQDYERLFDKYQISSIVCSLQKQGIFTGKNNDTIHDKGICIQNLADNPAIKGVINRQFETAQGEIAEELGCSQSLLAMAHLIKNYNLCVALTSATCKEQLDDTVNAFQVYKKLTPEQVKKIKDMYINTKKKFQLINSIPDNKSKRDLSLNINVPNLRKQSSSEIAAILLIENLQKHKKNTSKQQMENVKKYFTNGRQYLQSESLNFDQILKQEQIIEINEENEDFNCNPFAVKSDHFELDLLTDSGTSSLTLEQIDFIQQYQKLVPSIHMFSYARCTPREHLELVVKQIFGDQFNFYPALQGRAAERMLLNSLIENQIIMPQSMIITNRPFDTTKGHIQNSNLRVNSLCPMANPFDFYNSRSVFLGNIDQQIFENNFGQLDLLLMTITDNGGGGQPVSMENYKKLAKMTHQKGKLVWVDGCRIFENAVFIKVFELGYESHSLVDIVQEILLDADVVTVSFKKMYSHSGGAVFVNRNSQILSQIQLNQIDSTIKRQTTTDYGNGYNSYSGLTGEGMIEIISGLMCAIDEEIVGQRISQCALISSYLYTTFNFPIFCGGHAIYIAADQILTNVKIQDCPAEYLNSIMIKSIRTRGCGLGYLVYGGRKIEQAKDKQNHDDSIVFTNKLSMDSLRLAIPRNLYQNEKIIAYLSVIARAFQDGKFKQLKGGLRPLNYVDNGFYHFGGTYEIINDDEFNQICAYLKNLAKGIE